MLLHPLALRLRCCNYHADLIWLLYLRLVIEARTRWASKLGLKNFQALPLLTVEWLQPALIRISLLLDGYPRRSHECAAVFTGSYLRDLIDGGAAAFECRIIEITPTSFSAVMPTGRVVQFRKSMVCVLHHCELLGRCRLTYRQVQVDFSVGVIDKVECLPRQVAPLWNVIRCFKIHICC